MKAVKLTDHCYITNFLSCDLIESNKLSPKEVKGAESRLGALDLDRSDLWQEDIDSMSSKDAARLSEIDLEIFNLQVSLKSKVYRWNFLIAPDVTYHSQYFGSIEEANKFITDNFS